MAAASEVPALKARLVLVLLRGVGFPRGEIMAVISHESGRKCIRESYR
jgi:hypothetical protein